MVQNMRALKKQEEERRKPKKEEGGGGKGGGARGNPNRRGEPRGHRWVWSQLIALVAQMRFL